MKKTLIAASVGALMLAAAGTASANSLLFPYFTTATGATSVLSLSTNTGAAAAGEALHYVYNYGKDCTHYDGMGSMTNNDLMQHSIAAPTPVAKGFGKVVASDASKPFFFPLADQYGFLVVSTRSTGAAKISGDMALVDPATGLIASYAGIDNNLDTAVATNEGDFRAAITDTKFNLSFYPQALVTTGWYGVVTGNMNASIVAGTDWAGSMDLANGTALTGYNVYDNDEHAFSGQVTKTVKCAAPIAAKDLMNTAQQAAIGPNGGLIHATAAPTAGVGNPGTALVMTKLQILNGQSAAFLHREQAPAF